MHACGLFGPYICLISVINIDHPYIRQIFDLTQTFHGDGQNQHRPKHSPDIKVTIPKYITVHTEPQNT